MKIKIDSNGTVGKTRLVVDGVDLTAEDSVVSLSFDASVQYYTRVSFSYSTRHKNDDGSVVIKRYEYRGPDDDSDAQSTMQEVTTPEKIGTIDDELLISQHTIGDAVVTNEPMMRPIHAAVLKDYASKRRGRGPVVDE